ncbi:replication initiator protein A [Hyphomicrobium sp.]|jgi:plasmid replication initiation protein|uniref:replication initiator protein A n=1 Tax=Hyphomicrobium sp. TaxID=82 RepID=UPI0035669C37
MRNRLLLPDRHPVGDFFVLDNLFDVSLKSDVSLLRSDVASLEHPIFKLSSRKGDKEKLERYEHGDYYIELRAGPEGFATIFDKDIWYYAISNLIRRQNNMEAIGQTIRIMVHDLMKFTNRDPSGDGYDRLEAAVDRLAGTRVKTNIPTGGVVDEVTNFGLIESYKYPRRKNGAKRSDYLELVLPKWLLNAIEGKDVLTMNMKYFNIRKAIHRQIYEIVCKHCGYQENWKIGLELLKKKCGSSQANKHFISYIRELEGNDVLPDYEVTLERNNMVLFTKRPTKSAKKDATSPALASGPSPQPVKATTSGERKILISSDAIERAKVWAPRWDIGAIEQQYIARAHNLETAFDEDARFVAWVKSVYKGNTPP